MYCAPIAIGKILDDTGKSLPVPSASATGFPAGRRRELSCGAS
jgi:hypothetical protein